MKMIRVGIFKARRNISTIGLCVPLPTAKEGSVTPFHHRSRHLWISFTSLWSSFLALGRTSATHLNRINNRIHVLG